MAPQHTVQAYQAELQELRDRLETMTDVVYEMIANAREALTTGDMELAERTVQTDHQVNQQEVEIDRFCLEILVRRQSVAGDLRFILAAMKMVTQLERIGDQAASICHEVTDRPPGLQPTGADLVDDVAEAAKSVVDDAITAFLDEDVDRAFEAIDADDEVNEEYERVSRQVLSQMGDGELAVETGISIQSIAKRFERMADCATNIAEAIIFALDAQDIRHRDKLASPPTGDRDHS